MPVAIGDIHQFLMPPTQRLAAVSLPRGGMQHLCEILEASHTRSESEGLLRMIHDCDGHRPTSAPTAAPQLEQAKHPALPTADTDVLQGCEARIITGSGSHRAALRRPRGPEALCCMAVWLGEGVGGTVNELNPACRRRVGNNYQQVGQTYFLSCPTWLLVVISWWP